MESLPKLKKILVNNNFNRMIELGTAYELIVNSFLVHFIERIVELSIFFFFFLETLSAAIDIFVRTMKETAK